MTGRDDDRAGRFLAIGIAASLLLHVVFAIGLSTVEPPEPEPLPPVKIAIVPRPAPAEPPVVEPPPPPPEVARTATAVPDRGPEPRPQRRPPPARKQQRPPPEAPRPPSGGGPPPSFGIRLENTPLAAPGTGVPLPAGDTLATDPADRGGGKGRPRSNEGPPGPPGPPDVPLAAVQEMPKLVGDSVAEYPADVRRLGVQGRVVLELTVDEGGRVAGAKVVRKVHPRLDEAALLASRSLKFAPGTLDGRPVRVRIPYSYVFVLE